MENSTETIGTHCVLFFADQGELLGADVNTFIGEAWGQNADWVAIPVSRLSPDFLALSTRLAGEVMQKFVTYRVGLAIIGDISNALSRSQALRDFVRETNKGTSVWFLPSAEDLRQRLHLQN